MCPNRYPVEVELASLCVYLYLLSVLPKARRRRRKSVLSWLNIQEHVGAPRQRTCDTSIEHDLHGE